ncbi:hypothetical protein LWI28_015221 [Acer negundo]|uniref:Uncharacterized protein n=1 Tax=Acer negundo TaxID=4023 RepID=A0AAD5I9S5_ACENE|nr:hypothetical protein LWI28_015221 [Acer negundo]
MVGLLIRLVWQARRIYTSFLAPRASSLTRAGVSATSISLVAKMIKIRTLFLAYALKMAHLAFVGILALSASLLYSQSEIGKTWHLLPIEERAKFGQAVDAEVAARNISAEQLDHQSFVIPNNSDFPPIDEEIPSTTNHLGHEAETINTRCTPSRWCRIVKNYPKSRNRFVLNSSVFARVLGISDFGDQISISGDVSNLDFWKSKFPITSCGIFLKDIEHSLEEMTTADDEFKVTLCLFLLDTILSPSANDYVQMGYLIPLRDVGIISLKNWSSWCFSSLCKGIEKFQKNRPIMKTCCISGCVLFLQISVEEFFKQPTQSNGQYNGAAHGENSQANQRPVTGNHAHMIGIANVLQLVKEIQSTMKTELDDIRTKVNFLYDKFSSAEDKNLDNNLHNTSSHHNSMHNIPLNPTPPPPSSQPLYNPTSQHLTIEVSSNNTRTLPQNQQSISKSTLIWMKAPSEPPLEDGNTPNLQMEDLRNDDPYYVPLVLTVPSLVDERKKPVGVLRAEERGDTKSTNQKLKIRFCVSSN